MDKKKAWLFAIECKDSEGNGDNKASFQIEYEEHEFDDIRDNFGKKDIKVKITFEEE